MFFKKIREGILRIECVVPLPQEDSGLQHSIVRLNNRNVDASRTERSRFFRREPVVIINPGNGAKVIRYVMGNPGTLSIAKAAAALDYDAVAQLNIRFKVPVSLEIRRASKLEVYQWFLSHPDLAVQLSIKLGVIGSALGVLGFLTGVLPLLLA